MREILFRGKDVKGNWHIGLLAHIGNAWYISNQAGVATAYEVIPATVGQFTGLTDKNGKKIFEGDIIKHYNDTLHPLNYEVYKVVFSDRICAFEGKLNKNWAAQLRPYLNYEVIGNIHNNPELLEVE